MMDLEEYARKVHSTANPMEGGGGGEERAAGGSDDEEREYDYESGEDGPFGGGGGGGGGDGDGDDDDPEESYPELDDMDDGAEEGRGGTGGVIKPMGFTKRTARLKRRIPMRTCVASVGLLVAGVVLLILALDFYFANPNHDGAIPVLILAAVALVPGIYSSVNLYGVLRGWRGYRVDSIPSYEKL